MNSADSVNLVAVTGVGMICPLGVTASSCWESMLHGKSGIARITKFDPSECVTQVGGQLPEEYFELEAKKTSKRLFKQTVLTGRVIRLCAQEAIEDSGINTPLLDSHRCAVIVGTSGSSVRSPHDLGGPGTARFKVIREMINALPAWISLDYGFRGPSFTVSAACSSGSYAITNAYDLIRSGVVDLAVVGGVDALLTKNNIDRGNFMKLLSEDNEPPERAIRPFEKRRSGFVISDGGCAVVLESFEHAKKRDAHIYAYMTGYGARSESYSLYAPAPYGEGMAATIEMALANANIPKEKVGYVSANGTGTIVNDLFETQAMKRIFGTHAYNLLISSQKSMIGHTMGAAGAIQFVVTALVLKTQKVPPTINYELPDPECDLNYVPNTMVTVDDLHHAITNSFGLGGHNIVIVLQGAE
jgi:3-oxoacyl-[acyl-carrier-protein] synthase II